VVWIWRNGRLDPHKLDRVIAAGQLDLGDASERSSCNSEVALRSHEYLDTSGGHETRRVLGLTYQGQAVLLVFTQTSPDVSRFLTAFFLKLVVVCGGPDGGMILLRIRSSNGKKGSFDVKGLPYAS